MKLSKIAAVTLLLFVALAAFSQHRQERQYLTGTELLSYCESGTVTNTGTWCLGYILGVWHTTAPELQACPPPNVTSGELRHAVVSHLRNHPETLNRQPVDLVIEAMVRTFPCS
ncbi:MAG: Rap1a/Tai family immunity protein [Acidiferrobacterales bacterium]